MDDRELFARWDDAVAGFARRLARVGDHQWAWRTPCAEWDVRALVNHVVRGHVNYLGLVRGGDRAEFLRLRDVDALGADAREAFARHEAAMRTAFAEAGALERVLDYPLGPLTGRRALGIRVIDTTIHTWDLARAIGADEHLDAALVTWVDDHWDEIYAPLVRAPFFATALDDDATARQTAILGRSGRRPNAPRDHQMA